jgi:hypothetical protein
VDGTRFASLHPLKTVSLEEFVKPFAWHVAALTQALFHN